MNYVILYRLTNSRHFGDWQVCVTEWATYENALKKMNDNIIIDQHFGTNYEYRILQDVTTQPNEEPTQRVISI